MQLVTLKRPAAVEVTLQNDVMITRSVKHFKVARITPITQDESRLDVVDIALEKVKGSAVLDWYGPLKLPFALSVEPSNVDSVQIL